MTSYKADVLSVSPSSERMCLCLCLCLRETWSRKTHDYCDVKNEKPVFSNFFALKSIFEKLCVCDRLLWVVGQSIEINLCYKIFLA